MKITTFNPQIITKDADSIVKLFEELGFEKRHNPSGIGDLNVEGIRMKDANGFYLDISQPDIQIPQDIAVIRMNVDDFDEAYDLLTAHGFKSKSEGKPTETGSSKGCMMISPSGFSISISKHYK